MILNFQSPIPWNIILSAGVIILAVLILFFSFRRERARRFLQRGLGAQLFLVSVPQMILQPGEKESTLEEYLKPAEQFFYGLSAAKDYHKLKRWLFGNPSIVFEIAVNRLSEEINFYFACPRRLSGMIEKQVLSFWPKASVQPVNDYNIFNPEGVSLGAAAILERSAVLPLKNYQELRVDPLSSITSVLTKLAKAGEGAAVQVLVRPSKPLHKRAAKVAQSIQKGGKVEDALIGMGDNVFTKTSDFLSAQKSKKPEDDLKNKQEVTPIQQEIIAAITKKAAQPIFDVNLRLLASSSDIDRTRIVLAELESAFDQFNTGLANRLKFKHPKRGKLKSLFYYFSFRIFDERNSMKLSAAELAGIFHFPLTQLLTPHLKWLKAKQAPPPENMPEEGLTIGQSVFRGEERLVRMLQDDRRRHFYIIGQTGTGKSAFLSNLVRQDIESGEGLCLIDPHGELAEKVLAAIPPQRAEDVIYFNPADPERALGLNMLEYNAEFPESKTLVVNEMLEIFEKLYNLQAHGFGGPIFEQYMRNSLLLVMESPESGSTLIEIPRVLADTAFRKYKLSHCKNIVVKNFWELEAEKAGGEASLANMVPYITSKMNIFIANDMMRPIIAQQKSAFNFREVLDSRKILLVNLSKGLLGDTNSFLLGMIIVGKLMISALSRADVPEEQRPDFHLYIDEFQNVTTKTISSGLSEARKYHLDFMLAHQFIGQLDEPTQKAIFGNVGSMMVFRVGADDAKYLVTQFGPTFDEKDLVNLDNYNAALRLLIRGETSKPFNIVTLAPKNGDPEIAKLIKELSRAKYGKNRALVEMNLSERLQQKF
ncbi:MAG: type IV secretion system DNA-binding domain-containing protein [Candidatus Pacebacteria bacterium]|nr:type IV secretion system DNA-binding domain-containing protein [Candidatus Paceibacterota bacterium]